MLSLVSRISKKWLLVILFHLMMIGLLLTGCGNGEQPTIETPEAPIELADNFNSPIEINYTVKNPLEVIHKEMEMNLDNQEVTQGQESENYSERFRYEMFQIDGLKDEGVENKINEALAAAYEKMRVQDLPPYRGIKAKIPHGAKLVQEYIYMQDTGNFNNILSVTITKDSSYAIPNKNGTIIENSHGYYDNAEYVSEITCLNFDLNTGDFIDLKDIFADDVDYMKEINDYMNTYLFTNYSTEEAYFMVEGNALKLVESFKGLKAEPKFSLQPYGLTLYFDYETPEFNTGFYSVPVRIYYGDFDGKIAATQRYFDEKTNIFDSNKPIVKSLLISEQRNPVGGEDHYKDGQVNVFISWRFSSLLPKDIQDFIVAQTKPDEALIQKLNEDVKGVSQEELEKRGGAFYEKSVYADNIGGYINVSAHEYSTANNKYDQRQGYYCFEEESLKQLSLSDIFKEGFDYNEVLIASFKESLKGSIDNVGTPLEFSTEDITDILNHIEGFTLMTDSVNIPIAYTDSKGVHYSWFISVEYEDFGCENMLIF